MADEKKRKKAPQKKKLIEHKPAGHGEGREKKSFARPKTEAQRRAEQKRKKQQQEARTSEYGSLNAQYSVSGQKAAGVKPYRNKKEILADDIAEMRKKVPPPQIVHLDESHEVLAQIEDKQLQTRLKDFLSILLEGGKHKTAMEMTDFNWNHIQNLRHRYPGLHELWILCRDIGDEYRQILRYDAAHERAVEGVEEAIYAPNGKYLGTKRIYSDKLLELLLKADNPEKFSDRHKVDVEQTVINLTTGFDREQLREAEVEEVDGGEGETS